jgi:hypothetical protein
VDVTEYREALLVSSLSAATVIVLAAIAVARIRADCGPPAAPCEALAQSRFVFYGEVDTNFRPRIQVPRDKPDGTTTSTRCASGCSVS